MMNKAAVIRLGCYAVLAAITLEAAARLDDWITQGADPLAPYTINTLFRASEHGREGVPNRRFGKWAMNEWGYRGPLPQPGRINVVTFGASETFGLYETEGKEYPRQLEAQLNARRPDAYSVTNIALPGMRIGRTGYLKAALDKTGADYVVVYPSPSNYIGIPKPLCGQATTPVPPEFGLADRLRIASKVDQLAKATLPDWVMSSLKQLSLWRAMRGIQQTVDTAPDDILHAQTEDLRCVAELASRHGAQPIFVTHASYFAGQVSDESRHQMNAWRIFYPQMSEAGMLDLERRSNDAIRQLGASIGVPVVDAAAAIPGGPDNFADFVHFNDAGSARMAALIAQAISATQSGKFTPTHRADAGG